MKKTYLLRSAVLAAFLILSHITASAYDFAVDGIYYNITSTTDLTVEVTYGSTPHNSYSGNIIIPDTVTCNGITYTVTGIGDYAFRDCDGLASVTIPDAVTSIGNYAFYNWTSLTSITIPDAITSIGTYAFYGCTGLTSITIPNSVMIIKTYAFRNCTHLTSLTIPVSTSYFTYQSSSSASSFDNTVITDLTITGEGDLMNYAFYNFTALQNVTLSDGITNIGKYAFAYCTSLTSITIPDAVTSIANGEFCGCSSLASVVIPDAVTSIGESAFYGCTSLTSITIPDAVTSIGESAFSGCTSLTSITIPDAVTSIEDETFYNCTSLPSIIIPEAVTSIGYRAFYGCSNLTSITIPDAVTSIGNQAFKNCSSLTSLTIPVTASYTTTTSSNSASCPFENAILTDLTITGEGDLVNYAFYNASSLENVTLGDGITSIGTYAFYGCTGLTSVTIPDAVTNIDSYAFYGCTGLTSLTIGDAVTTIGSYAFYGCTGLTSVTIPDSVTSVGKYAFKNCTQLTSLTIPVSASYTSPFENTILTDLTITGEGDLMISFYKFSALQNVTLSDGITSIGDHVFQDCTSLTSIIIPDAVTSIGDYAFCGCTSLTSITIPDAVTSIGNNAFGGCKQLTSLTIPVSASYTTYNNENINKYIYCPFEGTILTDLTITGEGDMTAYAFYDFTALQNVTLSDGITNIGSAAFRDCTSLTSVTIPESVTSIGGSAFYGCTSLTSITIPESVTSIGGSAFRDCTGLTSITIPDAVTSIGNYAFYGCTGLTSTFIGDGVTSIGNYAFRGCSSLTSLTIPVSASYSIYKASWPSSSNYSFEYTILTDLTITGEGDLVDYAFYKFTALQNVTLGDGITGIGEYAFSGCSGLTAVYSFNSTPPTCASSNCFSTDTYSKATLHIPSASLIKYSAATAWKLFLNIEEDVETVGISGLAADDTSFSVKGGSVIADGLADGTIMSVYSLDGRMIGRTTASGGSASMQVPSGVVIVRVGGHSSKILVR